MFALQVKLSGTQQGAIKQAGFITRRNPAFLQSEDVLSSSFVTAIDSFPALSIEKAALFE